MKSAEFLKYIFLGFVVAIAVKGGQSLFAQEADKDIQEIQFSVGSLVSIATITISDDTCIKYEESSQGKQGLNREVGYLSQKEYEGLVALILGSDFFSFNEDYSDPELSDVFSYTVSVKISDKLKSVRCFGTCPDPVVRIIDKIRELWGKEIPMLAA